MPSTNTSPFATAFKSSIKRGVPCSVAVEKIAGRNNKTVNFVFNSLWKAGLCYRQKMNGQWIYWPCDGGKGNATNWKVCQSNMWQCFIDWCICCGVCTPQQLKNNCGSQIEFMNYCKKFWTKQFTGTTKTKSSGRRTTTSNVRKTRTTGTVGARKHRSTGTRVYKNAA